MAYATVADVVAIWPDEYDDIPSPPPQSLLTSLEEATDLVEGYLERQFTGEPTDPASDPPDLVPGDVPGAVRRVVARVTMRGILSDPANPGAESEVNLMGPFSHTVNWSAEATSRDFYLTESDKLRIERWVVGYTGAAGYAPMATARDSYA